MFDENYKFSLKVNGIELEGGMVLPGHSSKIKNSLKDLSLETIRHRFLGVKKDFSESELNQLTHLDHKDHVAIGLLEKQGQQRGVGIARFVRNMKDKSSAEFAITIIDDYQKLGLGTKLLELLILAAKEKGITTFTFSFLAENDAILKLVRKFGKPEALKKESGYWEYRLKL
jgi:ribosomal protein S18 acetylase RimI-like enzyme